MNTNILNYFIGLLLVITACGSQDNRIEQNKALTLKANQEILNNRNIAYVDSVFAEEYRFNGNQRGREAIKNFISTLLKAFPDLEVTIEPILAEGELVGWRRTHIGTHREQIMGIPASNQQITWESIILTHISEGKIVEEWGHGNLRQQLEANVSEN